MSRIIVKNLPGRITDQRLKDLFSKCGDITDIKLVKTKAGVFRRFAFVGFFQESQAVEAVKHFNKTFVNSSKIEVEIAKPYKDDSLSRPWSKYSKGSSAFNKRDLNRREGVANEGHIEDSKDKLHGIKETKLVKLMKEFSELDDDQNFQEFVETHEHKSKTKPWADSLAREAKVKGQVLEPLCESVLESQTEEDKQILKADTTSSDIEYLRSKIVPNMEPLPQPTDSDSSDSESDHQSESSTKGKVNTAAQTPSTPYTIKMLGLPFSVKEKDILDFFHPMVVVSMRFTSDQQGRPSGRGYVDFKSEQDLRLALKRNKDCIRHRYIELFRDDGPQATSIQEKTDNSERPWERGSEPVEDMSESGRLFVRNLSYSTAEDDLTKLFEKFGPLTEVTIPLDRNSNKPTGFAFVTYMFPEHAVLAYQALDSQIFQGRLMHILPAKPRTSRDEGDNKLGSSYKNKMQQKAKAEAGKGHNWNSLFLGPNAVVDALANKYSVDKSSVLDPLSDGSAAVRVALGETLMVTETREYMESKGVCLEMFGDEKYKRSKTIVLVKNLPFGTSEEELAQLFESFGQLVQIILPPAGVSALVEFAESAHAKSAFQKLAYSSFKHLPLYLEWAPDAVIDKTLSEQVSMTNDDNGMDEVEATIFVKNLNFSTSEESLHSLMAKVGKVKSVNIAKKLDVREPSKPLSMGYGFVEFEKRKAALKAIRTLQHSDLDGHQLELKHSTHRTRTADQSTKRQTAENGQASSKILVRNIPFEASKQEIKELFQTFGQLKMTRLPKKFGSFQSDHRGFGFVEFTTKEDAKRAFSSLCQSTHLYGRRLVLEWAETEESVEAIRKRTAEHFYGFKSPGVKRTKNSEQTLVSSLEKIAG